MGLKGIIQSLVDYAKLASPTFTGTVSLPTTTITNATITEVASGLGAAKLKLLATGSITGADNNSISITGLSLEFADYAKFILIAELDRDAGTGDLQLKVNGAATNYGGIETQFDSTPAYVAEAAQTSSKIATTAYGTDASVQGRAEISIYLPNDVVPFGEQYLMFYSICTNYSNGLVSYYNGFNSNTFASLTSIELFISTGASKMSIGSKLYLYGVRK
ncbi:MAG TPA: hypothetical protein VIH04_07955 [Nitrosarchaeum sp.]